MENEKTQKDVKKLNAGFVQFVGEVKAKNFESKPEIEATYSTIVGLRFRNILRVYKRVMRKELKKELLLECGKYNLTLKELDEISKKIVKMSRVRKVSNYIEIEN